MKGRAREAVGQGDLALPYRLTRAGELPRGWRGATPKPRVSQRAELAESSGSRPGAQSQKCLGKASEGEASGRCGDLPVPLPLAGPRTPQSGRSRLPRPPPDAEGSEAQLWPQVRESRQCPKDGVLGHEGRQGRARRAQSLFHPFPARLPRVNQWQAVAADWFCAHKPVSPPPHPAP